MVDDDPQIDALAYASGHTRGDAITILIELNKIGWSVRPITGLGSEVIARALGAALTQPDPAP